LREKTVFSQQEDLFLGDNGNSENEALQTDIQRFIAILGFCLMAVFALIQSIPVTGTEKEAAIKDFGNKTGQQEADLSRLKSENGKLKKEVSQLMKRAGISRRMEKELKQASYRIDRQKEKIEKLASEKTAQEKEMKAFKGLLLAREEELKKLKASGEYTKQFLKNTAKTGKGLTQKETILKPTTVKPAKKTGHYVAFSSDQIFLDLLSDGKIYLFINVIGMEQGFRALKRGGEIEFEIGEPDQAHDLWEVKKSMVPSEILNEFRAWTTLSSREKMFIVGLPSEIFRQIRGKKFHSGRFLIGEGGRVTHTVLKE